MPHTNRLPKTLHAAFLLILIPARFAFAQNSIQQVFFTTSDGVKLHYQEAGQGQAILFVPGWLMPADIWENQIRDLSKDYHVIALDPRSQGESDMTPQGNDPLRRSKDIDELLDHLHLDSVVLVGWSLGAFDVLAYLRQFGTAKVFAAVLVDSPLAAPSTPAPAQRSPYLQRFQGDRRQTGADYVWSLFKQPLPRGFYKKLEAAEALVPTDIALSVLDNTRPGQVWEPSIQTLRQVPLLYAVTPTYASQAQYLLQIVPWARVEKFENCGHALFVDQAARFDAVLRDFLKQASLYPPGLSLPKKGAPPLQAPVTAAPAGTTMASGATAPSPMASPSPTFTPFRLFTFVPSPTSTSVPTAPIPPPTPSSTPFKISTFTPAPASTPVPGMPAPMPTPTFTLFHFFTFAPSPTSTSVPRVPPSPSVPTPTPSPIAVFMPLPVASPVPSPVAAVHRRKKGELPAIPIRDGYFTTSDHVKLHYLEAGQGLTLVFIPGWLISARIWEPQLEDLSKDYHVVALDPRSQGLSDMTPEGDEPLRQAKDIQELLDHLQLNSAVLVGWSHGGFQVLAYMNEFGTDRLYAVALVDSSLGAAASPVTTGRQAKFLEDLKTDRTNALRGFVWSLFKKPPPPDFIRELSQDALLTPPDIALALLNNVFPGDRWQPTVQTLRQVPIFYAVTPKLSFQANYLAQVSPLAHVEVFENTGHALFVDDAERFNSALRVFLRQAAFYPPQLPPRLSPKPTATPHP